MKNIKSTTTKIVLQAKEANDQGLETLAKNAMAAAIVTSAELDSYALKDLKEDVKRDLWKAAAKVMIYHDVDSVDIMKVDAALEAVLDKCIAEIERSLNKKASDIGALEPKVPGQN